MLALAAPWIGLWPTSLRAPINAGALLITVLLIGWNLVTAVRLVGRTGYTLSALPLTLVQLVLFTLLFFQIAAHLGTEHYTWDQRPSWWDWVWFTGAHAVRAADVVDGAEAYGVQIQAIRHLSHLTAVSLIVFHLMVDLFIISLALEWVNRRKKALLEHPGRAQLVRNGFLGLSALLVGVWLISAWWVRPWRPIDMLLWPVDNVLRVVDVMDAMEIYQVRLHLVPRVFWEESLTFLCRVLLTLALAGLLSWISREISIRWLNGFGISREDLEELRRKHRDSTVRLRAGKRLEDLGTPLPANSGWQTGWPVWGGLGFAGLVMALALFGSGLSNWTAAAARLRQAATSGDDPTAVRGMKALRTLGPYAEGEVTALVQAWPTLFRQRQLTVIDTLGFLGEIAEGPLGEMARGADEEAGLRAVSALQQIGPRAAPTQVAAQDSPYPAVRQAAEEGVVALGLPAVQPLIDTLTRENMVRHYQVLERLDPQYWPLRSSGNPLFGQLCLVKATILELRAGKHVRGDGIDRLVHLHLAAVAVPALIQVLEDTNLREPQRSEAGYAIGDFGPDAKGAVPDLVKALADKESGVRASAIKALEQIGPEAKAAVPDLIKALGDKEDVLRTQSVPLALRQIGPGAVSALIKALADHDPKVRQAAGLALEQIDKGWARSDAARQAVPDLIKTRVDQDPDVRHAAWQALWQIDKEWARSDAARQAVPVLIEALADQDPDVRRATADVLREIGPEAKAAAPALIQALTDQDLGRGWLTFFIALEQIDKDWTRSAATRQAVPALIQALADKDLRQFAAQVLGRIGPEEAKAAVPALIEDLADRNPGVRRGAAEVLGQMGAEAKAAVPYLVQRLKDFNFEVREAATKALDQIDKDWRRRLDK
jgi:HEAT repeat protein